MPAEENRSKIGLKMQPAAGSTKQFRVQKPVLRANNLARRNQTQI